MNVETALPASRIDRCGHRGGPAGGEPPRPGAEAQPEAPDVLVNASQGLMLRLLDDGISLEPLRGFGASPRGSSDAAVSLRLVAWGVGEERNPVGRLWTGAGDGRFRLQYPDVTLTATSEPRGFDHEIILHPPPGIGPLGLHRENMLHAGAGQEPGGIDPWIVRDAPVRPEPRRLGHEAALQPPDGPAPPRLDDETALRPPAPRESFVAERVSVFLAWSAGDKVRARLDRGGIVIASIAGEDLARYGDLSAVDSRGKELEARFELTGTAPDQAAFEIVIEGAAEFPLTVRLRAGSPGGKGGHAPGAEVPEGPRGESLDSPHRDPGGRGRGRSGESRRSSILSAPDPRLTGESLARPGAPSALPPPANDGCAGAVEIPNHTLPAVTAPVDVIDATTAGDPVFCAATDRTIWFSFTAPATGAYTLTTCAASGAPGTTMPDTVLAVYSAAGGCAAPGAAIACNDDDATCGAGSPPGLQSTLLANLSAGTRYFIVTGRYAGTGQIPPSAGFTSIQIRIARLLPPPNDTCAGTIPLLALDAPVSGTTSLAANDYQISLASPGCYTLPAPPPPTGNTASPAAGRDVVYAFTSPSADRYSFRLSGYAGGQNPVLYLASDCPAGAPPVTLAPPACLGAANRNSGQGSEEVVCLPLAAGQTVYAFVDDTTAGNAGSLFTLEAARCRREAEPNGTPAAAGPLSCPVVGAIQPAGDVDFFALGAAAAGSRLFALADGAASNDTDTVMRITTGTDTLEFDDDDNAPAFGGLSPNVAGRAVPGAGAFVRINAFSTMAAIEPYRLYAVSQPPIASAAAESEPNGTLATASAAPSNYFSGSLSGPSPSGDVDLFRFAARAGTLIVLGLDGDPLRDNTPIDPKLELLDALGVVLAAADNIGSSSSTVSGAGSLTATTPFSPGESLVYRTPDTAAFYARVSIGSMASGPAGSGDYLLSIGLNCLAGDADGDGVANGEDCAPADPAAWAFPSPARDLRLAGRGPTTLTWSPSAAAGSTAAPSYSVLRSPLASDFSASVAICIPSGGTGSSASDSALPPGPGSAYFYVVRAANACGANLGVDSAGVSRIGRTCP